ncbi:ABC transporter substrate-binding protein [Cellulomonas sp. JH27-2]|uniref:ABC transporter substrate-binding protein n=1 Tax=Cellulomonas sp. JH27-2 TaxID=2774139 RepID=UPI001785C5FB|nr:ABC transporter substrate-binding protein [Cellulomonas sp. JH27-2]MBD8058373.1 ABC transporter substrate-binding protein [Cellulomonas sp. JH27-2]
MSARPLSPRTLRIATGLAALGLALTACSTDETPSSTSSSSASAANPVDGGDLTFAIGNDPISLNPTGIGSGNDTFYVTRQLVDSLTWQDPADGSLKPWLATKWEANADQTEFTFTLRDGVTFSDGTPFTAASVKANFDDTVAAGAKSSAAANFIGYQGTTVVDDHTVKVAFTSPNAAFPQATSTVALGFVADSTLAIPFDERASGKGVVGTGPFVLDHYTKDTETVLTARDGYAWAPADRKGAGAPHLAKVTFQVAPEASVRTGSLTSGQVQAIGGVQPTDIPTLQDAGLPLVSRANPGIPFGLTFNESSDLGKDPAVREAIALAIDPTEIRDTALSDGFQVAVGPLASTTPGVADESSHLTTDPAKAASVLEADGWSKGADGIYAKGGTTLAPVLAWITNFSPNQTSVELIQSELKAVGIDATLWSGAVPDFQAKLKDGSFDLVWGNLSRADGDVLRTQYSTTATNFYRIDDPTLEKLLQEQLATGDEAKRTDLLAQAQERLVTQHHVIPVHELTTYLGLAKDAHGIELGADSRLDQLSTAWVD